MPFTLVRAGLPSWKNSSKIRCRSSGRMPMPVSLTSIRTPFTGARRHADLALSGVADRVGEQVADDALQQHCVAR